MTTITDITKRNNDFYLGFIAETTTTTNYAHPVYTNVESMTDKQGTSRTLKHISERTTTSAKRDERPITKEEAQNYMKVAEMTGQVDEEATEFIDDRNYSIGITH